MMAATTIRTRTRFRPPKIHLHCRLGYGRCFSRSLTSCRTPLSERLNRAGTGYVNTDQEEWVCSRAIMALGLLEDMSSFLCPGGWVLRISSDRDDQRIFWGLKFSISGFFGVGKFWQVFSSLGSLIEVGIFWGIQNNLKIRDSYTVKFRK